MSSASRKEVHIKITVNDDTLANKLIHAFNSNDPIEILGSDVKVGCIDYKEELGGANVLAAIGGEMMKLNIESDEMTTYNSYESAKIANPDSDIYKSPGVPEVFTATPNSQLWFKCNPADHCMTVEQFLKAGYKFQVGDLFTGTDGNVVDVEAGGHLEDMHIAHDSGKYRYILRAAALEKPKRAKVEYVKCDLGLFQLESLFIAGSLFYRINGKYFEFDNQYEIAEKFINENIYRKVETEITERDEFIERFMEIGNENPSITGEDFAGLIFDKLVESE